ncbi:MAG: hypothetical protein SOY88_00180 [Massilioclostridium sp.]|nr:hypothetical protein [Massilioclostridium sp.]
MRFLIDENPILVMPKLAVEVGLNAAIVLQQLHYWLEKSNKIIDEKKWVYNTYNEWQKQFPFWGIATVKRIFADLEKRGLVLSANYNQHPMDKTKWYTIDYDALQNLVYSSDQNDKANGSICATDGINLISCDRINLIQAIPETTETTTETTADIILPGAKAPDQKNVFELPLNDKSLFPVSELDLQKYSELYPNVDISQEFRKMIGWLDANPAKRKTKKGIKRFINSWLSRQQDKGRYSVKSNNLGGKSALEVLLEQERAKERIICE